MKILILLALTNGVFSASLSNPEPREPTLQKRREFDNPGCGSKDHPDWAWSVCSPTNGGKAGTLKLDEPKWVSGQPWCYITGDDVYPNTILRCQGNDGWNGEARGRECLYSGFEGGGCSATE